MNQPVKNCLRCGKCCHDVQGKRCPNLRDVQGKLVKTQEGGYLQKTRCSIWKKRSNAIRNGIRIIVDGHACLERREDKRVIYGCPLNPQ